VGYDIRLCKVALLDGRYTLAFYGNVKDKQAFGTLLSSLKGKIPHLLLGYSTENQSIYQALVAARKSNPAGWRHAVYKDCVRGGQI